MMYLIRKKKSEVGSKVWFPGRKKRLFYRVVDCERAIGGPWGNFGEDYQGWRMKIVAI